MGKTAGLVLGVVRSSRGGRRDAVTRRPGCWPTPALRDDPVPFFDELRAQGPLIHARVSYLTSTTPSPVNCCAPRTSG